MRLFFYGTLLDADLRALVLGRVLPACDFHPAELRHFRRVYIAGRRYPMILPHRGGSVAGAVAERLSQADMARLCRYEGDDYRLERQTVFVADGDAGAAALPHAAWLFRGRPTTRSSGRDWDLALWQARDKAAYLRDLRDWLARRPAADPSANDRP